MALAIRLDSMDSPKKSTPMSDERDPGELDYLTVFLYAQELAKEDMVKLKAENARLKAEVEQLQNRCNYLERRTDE